MASAAGDSLCVSAIKINREFLAMVNPPDGACRRLYLHFEPDVFVVARPNWSKIVPACISGDNYLAGTDRGPCDALIAPDTLAVDIELLQRVNSRARCDHGKLRASGVNLHHVWMCVAGCLGLGWALSIPFHFQSSFHGPLVHSIPSILQSICPPFHPFPSISSTT